MWDLVDEKDIVNGGENIQLAKAKAMALKAEKGATQGAFAAEPPSRSWKSCKPAFPERRRAPIKLKRH